MLFYSATPSCEEQLAVNTIYNVLETGRMYFFVRDIRLTGRRSGNWRSQTSVKFRQVHFALSFLVTRILQITTQVVPLKTVERVRISILSCYETVKDESEKKLNS